MGKKIGLFLLFTAFLVYISTANASASREKVHSVSVHGDRLYVVTNEWNVKIFELPSGTLVKVLELPDRVSYEGRFGPIKKVVEDNGDLFIQAVASITNSYADSHIYHVHGESVDYVGTLYPVADLVGVDDQYLYIAPASKHISMGAYYRYDRQMKERFELHFDNAPHLVLADISESGEDYWYGCLDSIRNVPEREISGDVVLLKKRKGTANIRRYDLGLYQLVLGTVSIVNDKSSVWLLGSDNKNMVNKKIVEFSIGSGTSMREAHAGPAAHLIKYHSGATLDDSLWLVDQGNVFRVNKDSLQSSPLSLPDKMHISFNGYYQPITSDDNADLHRLFLGGIIVIRDHLKVHGCPIVTDVYYSLDNILHRHGFAISRPESYSQTPQEEYCVLVSSRILRF